MKANTWLKPELREQSFGSSYDPVLCGVAEGLARLFPPVDAVRWNDGEEEAVRDEARTQAASGAGHAEDARRT